MNTVNQGKSVLIIGGYGVVGKKITTILGTRYPTIPLIIAGRNLSKAKSFAEMIGYAQGIPMDVTKVNQISPLSGKLAAVISATNDPNNYILLDTIRNNIAYIDVTRWTARLKDALIRIAGEKNNSTNYILICMDGLNSCYISEKGISTICNYRHNRY